MSAALEFEGVVKKYKARTALDGLDLVVPRGSIFGLIGANGAGKTTAMSIAAGLLMPDQGRLQVLGRSEFSAEHLIGKLTLLPQDSDLPPYTIVRDALVYYGRLQGLSAAKARESAAEVLERTNMSDRASASIRTLSHGMRRRIAVAQAFLGAPELIILDEPLSGLDPVEVVNMRDFIASRRGKQTIIICSHNLHEIERICDEVAFLDQGKRIRQGTLDQVADHDRSMRYVLAGRAPVDELRNSFPEIEFESDDLQLTVRYSSSLTAESVNAQLLPMLLESGCGIRSIVSGASLEDAFLKVKKK